MDNLIAARLQMIVSLAFHMIYAAIGIGMPLLLVIVEAFYLQTGKPHYKALAHRWAKVTGLLFAVGAVSGTALSLELGLLWPKYMQLMGAVVGHLFGLEGYAFFLEAIFIGLYLYGWDRLTPWVHWWCGVVIATSGMLSGILVLGVNAWMQQPVGFEMEGGRVIATDPLAILRQPLWYYMAWHSTLACYMSVGFAVAGWYAWRLLSEQHRSGNSPAGQASSGSQAARAGLVIAMSVGTVAAAFQPLSGDLLAKTVFRTQPVKFAAMEGQFKTERHAPLRIGGWPDREREETRYAIEIPGGLSYMATGDANAEVPGLDRVPKSDWPNVEVTHLAFQVMVGSGTTLLVIAALFWWSWFRSHGQITAKRWLLAAIAIASPLGFVGLEAGWFVTEVGRQPWVIQHVMRTSDAVTPAAGLLTMLVLFAGLYMLLGTTVIVLLRRIAATSREE